MTTTTIRGAEQRYSLGGEPLEPLVARSTMPRVGGRVSGVTVTIGILLILAGCGSNGAGAESDLGLSATTADTTSMSASSAGPATTSTAASGSSDGTSEDAGASTTSTTSETGTFEGTTTSELPPPELCPTATSEAECADLHELCRWYPSYRVLDVETCALDEPVYGCWGIDALGPHGCFSGPQVCADLQQAYREIDGENFVLITTACKNPVSPRGEPAWITCPTDEFRPAPDVCYCLCGGPPDSTGGSGT